MSEHHENHRIEQILQKILGLLERLVQSKPIGARFDWKVGPVTLKTRKVNMLSLKITTEQQVVVHLNPVTPKGKPVGLDGIPTWTVVDGLGTVTPAADGLSATLVSPDTAGVTNFLVSADADLGAGVDTITDTIQLTVTDPDASSLGLVADAPTVKP